MKCTDKEWQHCRVEKMGCEGCYYNVIEIGEWVRLKDGRIRQFKKYLEGNIVELTRPYNVARITDVVKHSKNIIDLIELGDYVNGHLIVKIRIDPFNNKKQLFTEHWDYNWQGDGTLLVFYDEDIKTIVTKEQFSSIKTIPEEN